MNWTLRFGRVRAAAAMVCVAAAVAGTIEIAKPLPASAGEAAKDAIPEAVERAAQGLDPKLTAQPDAAQPATPDAKVMNAGPAIVTTGVYINDIQELDFRTHSYAVDLYVWFRWKGSDITPQKSLEFMNRYAPNDHVRDNLYEEPKEMPDGSRYAIIRNQGRFSAKFQLEKYPFDHQVLKILFEDTVGTTAAQIYEADKIPVAINPAISLPGFIMGKPRLEFASNTYPTNFGDLTSDGTENYSRGIVSVPIERPLTALSVKTFVPVLLIIVCASLVFFVRPIYVDGRIGLGITALLTLVALQITAASSLPEVDYLMLIDKVYLVSYAFIILSLLRVVTTSWGGGHEERERSISRGDRIWALVLGLAYIGALTAIMWSGIAANISAVAGL